MCLLYKMQSKAAGKAYSELNHHLFDMKSLFVLLVTGYTCSAAISYNDTVSKKVLLTTLNKNRGALVVSSQLCCVDPLNDDDMTRPLAFITSMNNRNRTFSVRLPASNGDSETIVDAFVTEHAEVPAGEHVGKFFILYTYPELQRLGVNQKGRIVLDLEVAYIAPFYFQVFIKFL